MLFKPIKMTWTSHVANMREKRYRKSSLGGPKVEVKTAWNA